MRVLVPSKSFQIDFFNMWTFSGEDNLANWRQDSNFPENNDFYVCEQIGEKIIQNVYKMHILIGSLDEYCKLKVANERHNSNLFLISQQ